MFDKLATAKKAVQDANKNEKLNLTAEDIENIVLEECFDHEAGPESEEEYYKWWYNGAIEAAKACCPYGDPAEVDEDLCVGECESPCN